MSALSVIVAVVVAVGLVGAVVQLPEILSHHINQPVQRARRVRALRRKLAFAALGIAAALAAAYAVVTGGG